MTPHAILALIGGSDAECDKLRKAAEPFKIWIDRLEKAANAQGDMVDDAVKIATVEHAESAVLTVRHFRELRAALTG